PELIAAPRREPQVRQALRALSTILIVAGSLLLVDAVLTLVWQEPISAYLAQRQQDRLSGKLKTLESAQPHGLEQRAPAALGDPIVLEMPYGRFTYDVERQRIVTPDSVWVIHRVGYDRLVLSACHPLYSASHRIIVFARLVRTEPRGAALHGAGRTLVEKPQ